MASVIVDRVENIDIDDRSIYRFHLSANGNPCGKIDIDKSEINENWINDPIKQKIIIREFIHLRED